MTTDKAFEHLKLAALQIFPEMTTTLSHSLTASTTWEILPEPQNTFMGR